MIYPCCSAANAVGEGKKTVFMRGSFVDFCFSFCEDFAARHWAAARVVLGDFYGKHA